MIDEPLYPITVLIDELKNEDIQLRLNSIRRLSTIACALGEVSTRKELIPFLSENNDDDNEEVLLAMAEELGVFVSYVGSVEHANVLLPPLEGLCSVEETCIRDKAVESLCRVGSQMREADLVEYFILLVKVEPGVLITFVSLPEGGNDLKRIRFSREMFNKWQGQSWWAENYDKVMELYNVQKFNQRSVPLPNPPKPEDENAKMESVEESPATPPLRKERLPRNFHRPPGMSPHSSDSLEHNPLHSHNYYDSAGHASTPKLSSISAAKTETSSVDASARSSLSREGDCSGELSVSNASDTETEWVEQDEPGVYITIRALPGGGRELRRVRFSRERFGEMQARTWWEANKARIQEQYL